MPRIEHNGLLTAGPIFNFLADGMGNLDVRVSNFVLGATPIRGILLPGCDVLEAGSLVGEDTVDAEGATTEGGTSEGMGEFSREGPAMAFVDGGLCEIITVPSISSSKLASTCLGSGVTLLGRASGGGRCT